MPYAPGRTPVNVRFWPDVLARVDASASARGESRMAAITRLLRWALDHEDTPCQPCRSHTTDPPSPRS